MLQPAAARPHHRRMQLRAFPRAVRRPGARRMRSEGGMGWTASPIMATFGRAHGPRRCPTAKPLRMVASTSAVRTSRPISGWNGWTSRCATTWRAAGSVRSSVAESSPLGIRGRWEGQSKRVPQVLVGQPKEAPDPPAVATARSNSFGGRLSLSALSPCRSTVMGTPEVERTVPHHARRSGCRFHGGPGTGPGTAPRGQRRRSLPMSWTCAHLVTESHHYLTH